MCDPEKFSKQADLWKAALESKVIFPTVGCHPKKVEQLNTDTWWELRRRLEDPRTCALGEIGLDYGPDLTARHKMIQRTALKDLLRMAVKMDKPIVGIRPATVMKYVFQGDRGFIFTVSLDHLTKPKDGTVISSTRTFG